MSTEARTLRPFTTNEINTLKIDLGRDMLRRLVRSAGAAQLLEQPPQNVSEWVTQLVGTYVDHYINAGLQKDATQERAVERAGIALDMLTDLMKNSKGIAIDVPQEHHDMIEQIKRELGA